MKSRFFALASAARILSCQTAGFGLMLAALSNVTYAGATTPEIDASSVVTALTLFSGGILIITNRTRRK